MEKYQITLDKAISLIKTLEEVFDRVRLVNVLLSEQVTIDPSGNLIRDSYRCYKVWNKTERCDNCISAKALTTKAQVTKFEFVNNKVYLVISKYLEIDGDAFALEMVSELNDETLFETCGNHQFADSILTLNKKLYRDSLTNVYNRRYFDEYLKALKQLDAVAMIDLDNFKEINDSFGHEAGDVALQMVAEIIRESLRNSDEIVRYGGDEFYLVFRQIPEEAFRERLHRILQSIHDATVPAYPDMRLSVSIGGVYSSGKSTNLLKKADELLYRAKQQKGHICLSFPKKKPQ